MLKGNSHKDVVFKTASPLTVTTNGPTAESGGFSGIVAYLRVSAVSGTSPSMTVKLQDSPDGASNNWYDIPSGAFTAVTAAGQWRLAVNGPIGEFVRAVATITGTNPSFTTDLQFSASA